MPKPKNGDQALVTLRATYLYGHWHLDYYEGDRIAGVSEYAVERVEPIPEKEEQ